MVFSIHAEYVESVNEIRPGISPGVRYAHIEGYWSCSGPGNLEAVIVSLNIRRSREIVDTRQIERRTRRRRLPCATLISHTTRVDDFEHGLHGIGLRRLQEIVVRSCVDLDDRTGRCARGIYINVRPCGAGVTIGAYRGQKTDVRYGCGSSHRRQRAGQNSKFTKHMKDKVEVGSRLWGITAVAHGNIGARITHAGRRPAQRSRQRIESKPRRYAADAPCVGWNPASYGKSCRIALVIQDLDKRRPGKRERIAGQYLEILSWSRWCPIDLASCRIQEQTRWRGRVGAENEVIRRSAARRFDVFGIANALDSIRKRSVWKDQII